jgi:hypothetical protein
MMRRLTSFGTLLGLMVALASTAHGEDNRRLVITGATTFGMGRDAIGEIAGFQFNDQTPGSDAIIKKCISTDIYTVSICAAKVDLEGVNVIKVYWAKQVALSPIH